MKIRYPCWWLLDYVSFFALTFNCRINTSFSSNPGLRVICVRLYWILGVTVFGSAEMREVRTVIRHWVWDMILSGASSIISTPGITSDWCSYVLSWYEFFVGRDHGSGVGFEARSSSIISVPELRSDFVFVVLSGKCVTVFYRHDHDSGVGFVICCF